MQKLFSSPVLRIVVIVLVVLAALGGGAAWVLGTRAAAASPYVTQTVGRGTVVGTVSTSGPISSTNNLALNFKQAGTLAELDVKVGDKVQAGQVLAKQDPGDLHAQVTAAQANVDKAVAAYKLLAAGPQPRDIAVAQAGVDSAKTQLANAQQSLATTKTNAQQDLQVSQTAVDSANQQVGQAQQNLSTTVPAQNAQDLHTAQVAVQNAQTSLDGANQNLTNTQAQIQADTAGARLAVDQAQAALTTAQNNLAIAQASAQGDIQAAQAQVQGAQ
ncbi:MAG TPA: biotin/lipoyl-binding protein, partial [Thermomicrobiales bacterium]|nr:biotin/lipoyl-binding protein [Thermomicrobiales bacterium]